MRVWHLTPDADRQPQRVTPGVPVHLRIGTWPIGPGQAVLVEFHVASAGGEEYCGTIRTTWIENRGENSYWSTTLGPFADGDRVTYRAVGIPRRETAVTARMSFTVGPAIHLALLWHHHQPLYRDLLAPAAGAYRFPWARLHALRDYFGMAFLLSQHPEIHLTIDFSPVLLWQLEDYLQGASDRSAGAHAQAGQPAHGHRSPPVGARLRIHYLAGDVPVAIFPSDRYVGDDRAFVDYVRRELDVVRILYDAVAVVRIEPSAPETEYGWSRPNARSSSIRRSSRSGASSRSRRRPWPAGSSRVAASGTAS